MLALAEVSIFFIILARIAGIMMMIPGFGDRSVPGRVRLMIAFALTMVIAPIMIDYVPTYTGNPGNYVMLLISELTIGLFLGITIKLLLSAVEVMGMVAGFQMGLLNAFVQNPVETRQAPLLGTFLLIIVTVLIFVLELHHHIIRGIVDSYTMMKPGSLPSINDISHDMMTTIVRTAQEAFVLALRLAAPFIVMGTCYFIGLGLLNRLMPQLQVFFIMQPFQILAGMVLLSVLLAVTVPTFMEALERLVLTHFQRGGEAL
ncbi:MAG: flagellar biosynthetic protein FliR [Alphaproteobacteria bacterium]